MSPPLPQSTNSLQSELSEWALWERCIQNTSPKLAGKSETDTWIRYLLISRDLPRINVCDTPDKFEDLSRTYEGPSRVVLGHDVPPFLRSSWQAYLVSPSSRMVTVSRGHRTGSCIPLKQSSLIVSLLNSDPVCSDSVDLRKFLS